MVWVEPAAIAPEVGAALVTAVVSLGVALWAQLAGRKTSAELTRLESELQTEREERSARRDYDYEALKRLYSECEPLLFQAFELARDARFRIASLARSARERELRPDGSGWLAAQGYYYKSTAYFLLAPATTFKILQRRLTAIDLGLDFRLRTQYELHKLMFLGFTRDFVLADRADTDTSTPTWRALDYDPDAADPGIPDREAKLRADPQHYARQGLYRGILEMITEALIATAPPSSQGGAERTRCKSLGEFWIELGEADSALAAQAPEIAALLEGFHPARKPVLWRVLVMQYLLYGTLLSTQDIPSPTAPTVALSDDDVRVLDWRHRPDEASDADVRAPVEAGVCYLRDLLARLPTSPAETRSTREETPRATPAG
jgi:hypothetical protein